VAAILPPEELLVLLDFVVKGRPGSGHSDHVGLMSLQASDKLGPTQIVKIVTRKLPQLSLSQDDAKLAQRILLEVFATNKDVRPFFTLGIVSSIICDMGLPIHCSCNPPSPSLQQPEVLTSILTKILYSSLLPNENGASLCHLPPPTAALLCPFCFIWGPLIFHLSSRAQFKFHHSRAPSWSPSGNVLFHLPSSQPSSFNNSSTREDKVKLVNPSVTGLATGRGQKCRELEHT
uniref:Uncharacterized protein n=1 Tax=Castor canadensis TaxID=51338 RepID=A0A8C0WMU8_CASCN